MAYELNQSPLYRLSSKGKLADLVNLKTQEIERIANGGRDEYRLFQKHLDSKTRNIEWPKPRLLKIPSRLNELIVRIQVPAYVHSGIKGRSYITNAKSHSVNVPLAKIDLKSFFSSASSLYVYKCFKDGFCCSTDVASVLTKLVTIDGHLPTGSPTSVIISYYAYQKMFDQIYVLASEQGLKMSLCVDDMTFSGAKATSGFLYAVGGICKKYGLKVHKRHCFAQSEAKVVTGVALTSRGFRLPNKRRKLIFDETMAYASEGNAESRAKMFSKIIGRVGEANQLEPKRYGRIKTFLIKPGG